MTASFSLLTKYVLLLAIAAELISDALTAHVAKTKTSSKTLVTCPLGQVRSHKTGKCTPCAPGSYNWYATAHRCLKCPAGTYTTMSGVVDKSLCQPCPPDSYSLPGSRSCTRCSRGHVREGGPHSLRCRRCRTRQECRCSRSKAGCANMLSRPKCPTGFVPPGPYGSYFPRSVCVQPDNGCPSGMKLYTWARRAVCANIKTGKVVCPSGTIFDEADRCLSCPTGSIVKFNKHEHRYQCARCTGSQVSDGGISTECRKCPFGFAPTHNRKSCFNTIPLQHQH